MTNSPLSISTRALLLTFCTGFAVAVSGCQQYAIYPNIPTAKGMAEDPNSPASLSAMVRAVQYVATRYTPGDPVTPLDTKQTAGDPRVLFPITVNPPIGLRRSFYERLCSQIGPDVQPMSGATDPSRPTYHVGRVWLRFNTGTVDVYRPMPELGIGMDGKPIYQVVTVRLEGGFEPWHVVHARGWQVGESELPAPYMMPEVDRVDQYEFTMHPERFVNDDGATSTTVVNPGVEPGAAVEDPGAGSARPY